MQQFKIGKEGYKKLRKRSLAIIIPMWVLIVTGIILAQVLSPEKGEFNSLPYVVPILLVFFGFSIYRALRKQKRYLQDYIVTISDSEITREQWNTPPLSINFMEIKEIIKSGKGTYTIKGRSRADVIYISYLIDNSGELEQRLEAFAPITVSTKDPLNRKYKLLLFLVAMGSVVTVYAATNKVIVAICGVLATGLLIWSFYEVRMSKNVPESTRRSSWFTLIIIASIIFVTYSKLTGILPAR